MNLVLYPLKNKGTVKEDNMQLRFFRCEHCGNIIAMVKDTGVPVFCCGQKMTELVAGTVEASAEKHIPVCTAEGGEVKVNVGSAEHPMAKEHFIQWIALQTEQGCQLKTLKAGQKPFACFKLCDGDNAEAVYAYCNLHGLWKAEV